MPTETRYMRNDQHTVNGKLAYKLLTSRTNSCLERPRGCVVAITSYWGIRVWQRTSGSVENEITSGTPVAQVSRTGTGVGLQSATWDCPEYDLDCSDAVIVRVYNKCGGSAWALSEEFITDVLNADKLDASTWTVYYYTLKYFDPELGATMNYMFGRSTCDSKIENFTYTLCGVPAAKAGLHPSKPLAVIMCE